MPASTKQVAGTIVAEPPRQQRRGQREHADEGRAHTHGHQRAQRPLAGEGRHARGRRDEQVARHEEEDREGEGHAQGGPARQPRGPGRRGGQQAGKAKVDGVSCPGAVAHGGLSPAWPQKPSLRLVPVGTQTTYGRAAHVPEPA